MLSPCKIASLSVRLMGCIFDFGVRLWVIRPLSNIGSEEAAKTPNRRVAVVVSPSRRSARRRNMSLSNFMSITLMLKRRSALRRRKRLSDLFGVLDFVFGDVRDDLPSRELSLPQLSHPIEVLLGNRLQEFQGRSPVLAHFGH